MQRTLCAALLAISALFTLTQAACGGSNSPAGVPEPKPEPGREAGVLGVAISEGLMSPGYRPEIKSYAVSLPSALDSVGVTATLVDPKASLWINGEEAQSGVPRQVGLSAGRGTVGISTLAEDGVSKDLVRLTFAVASEPNTRVWVLDSFGGSCPKGASITLADTSGRVLQSDIALPAEKNGTLVLALDPRGKYNIYAKANGSAQACFANFDRSREDTATLYCLPSGALAFPAEAPTITDVAFSDQAEDGWESLPAGANALSAPASKMQYVKVTARARSYMAEADWGPHPMSIMLDSPAWLDNAALGTAIESSAPAPDGGLMYYRSTYRFRVPNLRSDLAKADHWLDIVVYDVANNRVERRVYLTVTDAAASIPADPSLAQASPSAGLAQAQTYGISREVPTINPIDAYGSFYFTYLEFAADSRTFQRQMNDYWDPNMGVDPLTMIDLSGIDLPGVRGFEAWRSDGEGQEFKLIGTQYYVQLNRGLTALAVDTGPYPPIVTVGQAFQYRDVSPDVVEGTMRYRFRAFNGNPEGDGYSPFSDPIDVRPLPPFTTQLAAPANGAVVGTIWPDFKFRITNPALCKAGAADEFNFSLLIRPTYYTSLINRVRFVADFSDLYPNGSPRCYDILDDGFSVRKTPATKDRTPNGEPYVWLENGDTMVISTDNPGFRAAMPPFATELIHGNTYEWSIYGILGTVPPISDAVTNAAHFKKTYPAPAGKRSEAYSFGSLQLYGLGSPNGLFVLTVDLEAK